MTNNASNEPVISQELLDQFTREFRLEGRAYWGTERDIDAWIRRRTREVAERQRIEDQYQKQQANHSNKQVVGHGKR